MIINSEKAFDLLPFCAEIYDKLNIKDYITQKTASVDVKGKSKEDIDKLKEKYAKDMILYLLKNSSKIKDEFFSVISIVSDTDVETAKKQSPIRLAETLQSIFADKEFLDFFGKAMQ